MAHKKRPKPRLVVRFGAESPLSPKPHHQVSMGRALQEAIEVEVPLFEKNVPDAVSL